MTRHEVETKKESTRRRRKISSNSQRQRIVTRTKPTEKNVRLVYKQQEEVNEKKNQCNNRDMNQAGHYLPSVETTHVLTVGSETNNI
jgi:hypothetical protein